MKRNILIVLALSAISTVSFAKTTKEQSKLFLVGGGLKSCSSMAIKNCNTNALSKNAQLKQAKKENYYKIGKKTVNFINNYWPESFNDENQKQVIELITNIQTDEKPTLFSKSQLKSVFRRYDNNSIINKLNDAEYFLLLDLLEQPVLTNNGSGRLKEHVDLTNSNNAFSTEIYQKFVSLAKHISNKNKPKILVLTASARDPFEAVDFYLAAFTQAGGDTQWLPLDATLNSLINQPGDRQQVCQQLISTRLNIQGSANRELVYPDLTNQQLQACLSPNNILSAISQADGIFINGGDQSLTAKAFINSDGSDSAAFKLIKEKLSSNNLIIGGTSAGTAVMSGGTYKQSSIAMITNGQSNTAVFRGAKKDVLPQEGCQKSNACNKALLNDDLTYNSKGGLGLFHWGIMDTHFSERGRQGRLARLALDTNTRFAFGVDEATALIVSNINSETPNFEVTGQSGVFIVDNSLKQSNRVTTHYITRGDTAKLTTKELIISAASWKKAISEQAKLPKSLDNIFEGQRYQQMTQLLCLTDNSELDAKTTWKEHKKTIKVTKLKHAKSSYGVLTYKGVNTDYCSYQNYQMSFIRK